MSSHDAPSQPEPRTPVWLTALGACLFVALAFFLLAPHAASSDATIRVDDIGKPSADGDTAPSAGADSAAIDTAPRRIVPTIDTSPRRVAPAANTAPTGGAAPTPRRSATAQDARTPTLGQPPPPPTAP